MFKKESAVLLQIDPNPFILGLIGLCDIPTFYALVTEFVSGGDLCSFLQSDAFRPEVEKWETRVNFSEQIARGMLHLHSNRPPVIHNNLTARNVLVQITQYHDDIQFICKVNYSIFTGQINTVAFRLAVLVFQTCLASNRLRRCYKKVCIRQAPSLTSPRSDILIILTAKETTRILL